MAAIKKNTIVCVHYYYILVYCLCLAMHIESSINPHLIKNNVIFLPFYPKLLFTQIKKKWCKIVLNEINIYISIKNTFVPVSNKYIVLFFETLFFLIAYFYVTFLVLGHLTLSA